MTYVFYIPSPSHNRMHIFSDKDKIFEFGWLYKNIKIYNTKCTTMWKYISQ
jgi:hypothetical protein